MQYIQVSNVGWSAFELLLFPLRSTFVKALLQTPSTLSGVGTGLTCTPLLRYFEPPPSIPRFVRYIEQPDYYSSSVICPHIFTGLERGLQPLTVTSPIRSVFGFQFNMIANHLARLDPTRTTIVWPYFV